MTRRKHFLHKFMYYSSKHKVTDHVLPSLKYSCFIDQSKGVRSDVSDQIHGKFSSFC